MVHYKGFSILFQPGSPYIEEVNKQLQYLVEMGLINKWVLESVGNSTKCDTLGEMIASKIDPLTILSMKHVGSCFVLLGAGLMLASLAFLCEFMKKKSTSSKKSNIIEVQPVQGVTSTEKYYTQSRRIQHKNYD